MNFLDWLQQPAGANMVADRLDGRRGECPHKVMTFTFRTTYVGDNSEVVTNTAASPATLDDRPSQLQPLPLTPAHGGKGRPGAGDVSSARPGIACGGDARSLLAGNGSNADGHATGNRPSWAGAGPVPGSTRSVYWTWTPPK